MIKQVTISNAVKPFVVENLLSTTLRPKTCTWVFLQQLGYDVDERLRVPKHVALSFELKLLTHDVSKESFPTVRSKGRHTKEKLIDDYTSGPPVDAFVVARFCQDLRRVVLRSATRCRSQVLVVQLPGHAKVNNLQIALVVEHQVLQLEVSVHDVLFVQSAKAYDKLPGQEFYNLFVEPFIILQNLVELTALQQVHHKVQSSICLEDVVHLAQERMVQCRQNLELIESRRNLVCRDELVFPNGFDRKCFACVVVQ